MPFKTILPGTDPLATDADQFRQALLGIGDVGPLVLVPPQATPSAPTVAPSGSAGNLNGAYRYQVVTVTGWKQSDGSYYVSGFAPGTETAQVTITNNSANISAIPIGAAGTIGRAIYRTLAGGASGTEKFVGIIWDNVTTTFTDNIADANIGAGMPTSGSTPAAFGTTIPSAVPISNTTGTTLSGLGLNANLLQGIDGSKFARNDIANILTGIQTIIGNNGTPLKLKGGTANQVYLPFFANAAQQTVESGYVGFPYVGGLDMVLINEMLNGSLNILSNGTGRVMVNNLPVVVDAQDTRQLQVKYGSVTVTTDGSGVGTILYSSPFPNGTIGLSVGNGDGNTTASVLISDYGFGYWLTNGFSVRAFDTIANATYNSKTIRASYVALGY